MTLELRDLMPKMAEANPMWRAPRIHGKLMKLGIEIAVRTISRLMPKRRKPPSQTWNTFLDDHVIILGERHLRTILKSYLEYYHRTRTHLALFKDTHEPRAVQPPKLGAVAEVPEVGGLHHRYESRPVT